LSAFAIGAHPGDVELGGGGVLLRHRDTGHSLTILTLTNGEAGGIDEEAIWTVMRFADEPAERVRGRQLTRVQGDDPRGPVMVTKGQLE